MTWQQTQIQALGCHAVDNIYTQLLGNASPRRSCLPSFGSASLVLKTEYTNNSPPHPENQFALEITQLCMEIMEVCMSVQVLP